MPDPLGAVSNGVKGQAWGVGPGQNPRQRLRAKG